MEQLKVRGGPTVSRCHGGPWLRIGPPNTMAQELVQVLVQLELVQVLVQVEPVLPAGTWRKKLDSLIHYQGTRGLRNFRARYYMREVLFSEPKIPGEGGPTSLTAWLWASQAGGWAVAVCHRSPKPVVQEKRVNTRSSSLTGG